MKKTIQSTNFWLLSGFIAAVAFVYLVNVNQTYQSQTDVLILPKSQLASENFNQLMENTRVIIRSLSFYDSMIASNSSIEDGSQTYSLGKRKQYWSDKIKVERIGNSGVISILIYEDYINQAGILGEQSVETLKNELGKIYKIDEDVSIILIDGTTISESPKTNAIVLLAESAAAGFLISLVIIYLYNWVKNIKFSLKINFKLPKKSFSKEVFPWKKLEEMKEEAKEKVKKSFSKEPAESEDLEKQRQLIETIIKKKMEEEQQKKQAFASQESLTFQEKIIGKKASAPFNLPIFDEQNMGELISQKPSGETEIPPAEEMPVEREATEEEIKERLNKLLGGKL